MELLIEVVDRPTGVSKTLRITANSRVSIQPDSAFHGEVIRGAKLAQAIQTSVMGAEVDIIAAPTAPHAERKD
jgi:hypothetical protein